MVVYQVISMDPITQGALFGSVSFLLISPSIIPLPSRLSNSKIHQIVIGGVGGGIGGWVSTQMWTNPSGFSVFLSSLLGIAVYINFLGVWR